MRFGKISDPAPQTHPGILFFTNSKKYENTLGFLKIWGVLKQNGQNHAFLNSGGMSYPFNRLPSGWQKDRSEITGFGVPKLTPKMFHLGFGMPF